MEIAASRREPSATENVTVGREYREREIERLMKAARRSRPIGSRISGKTEMSKSRRFPPRWSIEELNNACFIVRDKAGHRIAYFCFDDEPGRRSAANMPAAMRHGGLRRLREVAGVVAGNVVAIVGEDWQHERTGAKPLVLFLATSLIA